MDQPATSKQSSDSVPHWAALNIEQHSLGDAELLELYRCSGSTPALNAMVRRHSPLVASVIRRLISNSQDAEDAFQATFLIMLLSVKKIRNPDSLGAWLYGVAYRTAKRMRSLRRKSDEKVILQSTLGIDLDSSYSPMEEPLVIIARELQLEAMDDELSKLPKQLREALIEHYLGGNSVPEIARCLNLSVTAVEGRLKRGRKALRLRLAMRGVSFSVVAAACIRFQQDVEGASAEPWSNRFLELYGSAGVGHPTLTQLLETKTVSKQFFKLVKGEVVVNIFSRSTIGVAGGILVLCALGTIGFLSALANQQSGTDLSRGNGNLSQILSAASTQESGNFVLAQIAGMGGGGMGGPGGGIAPVANMPKELVVQWEKPTSPAPSWVNDSADENEREDLIRRSLNDRIDINRNEASLSSVVAFISDATGITFIIDARALEEENTTPDQPVTITRKDTKVRDVLTQILEPLQLTYIVELEAIRITSKKTSANAIHYYDLSYIFSNNALVSELTTSIEAMVDPDQWTSAGGTSSWVTVGSMLVISTPQNTQIKIERMLRAIGKQSPANLKPRVFLDKPASKPAESEKVSEKR